MPRGRGGNVKEVAKTIARSRRQVCRYCEQGLLQATKVKGNWSIAPESVAQFLRPPAIRDRRIRVGTAAERLGCNEGTIYRYCRNGVLQATKVRGVYLIAPESLTDFVPPRVGRRPKRKSVEQKTRQKKPSRSYKYMQDEKAAQNRANVLVYYAIRSGKLVPQPCEECGSVKTLAHHDDYSRPLDVCWLCRKHHRLVHAA